MECNPHFCPAIFWGPQPNSGAAWTHKNPRAPVRQKAKSSSQDTKWDKQEGNSCSWERKGRQPEGIRKQIHKSCFKYLILTHAFCLPIWKERTTWRLPSLSRPGTTDRGLGELTLIRILTFAGFFQFPQDSAGSGASAASQRVSCWSRAAEEEGKWFSLYAL